MQPRGHVPVLAHRVTELLTPALDRADAVAVDATVGLGGHAETMLSRFPGLRLVGLDRDQAALAASRDRLRPYADRLLLEHCVFDVVAEVLARHGIDRINGALFDLGVSSMQLDDRGRGFAYSYDAALDMRMDQSAERTAADVLNSYPPEQLVRILREYGEERYAVRIVAAIERERRRAPLTSSARLTELVEQAIPAAARRAGGHPAKRTFQALRIEVNAELAALRVALPAVIDLLAIGGRVVVLSYHSLEDRIVKQTFAEQARDRTPPGLPVTLPEHAPRLRVLTRGAERPTDEEIADNPRAASARLRAAERLEVAA